MATSMFVYLLWRVLLPLLHDAWSPPLLHFAAGLREVVLLPHTRLAEDPASAGPRSAGRAEDTAQHAQRGRAGSAQSPATDGHHGHHVGRLSNTKTGDRMIVALVCV